MSLDRDEIKHIVDEKLADRRADAMIRWLGRSAWRPLLTAGVSGALGVAMLAAAIYGQGLPDSMLYGGIIFVGIAYMCFWAYRQNRVCQAVAHKLGKLEAELEKLRSALASASEDQRPQQEGRPSDSSRPLIPDP